MDKQVRIVRLRTTGLKARIITLPKDEVSFIVSYIYAPNKHAFHTQVLYYFCENFLQTIIPELVGKDKTYREKVFKELYDAVVEYNPDVEKTWKPASPKDEGIDWDIGGIMQIRVFNPEAEVQPKEKKVALKVTKEKVKSLGRALNKVVFGQKEAIKQIQEYFEMSMAGLSDPTRPRGSFLFIGDTGCGKTMTAKEIARHFFGKDWQSGLYVINGSEYMEDHETAKLLGSPQGYVGYEDGSPFFKHLQKNPECIVLVDEFEKANSRLQDVFLQILDEGIAYDNKGKKVDFSKAFIVFTSNIGTKEVYHKNPLGFCDSKETRDVENAVNRALSNFCRVEFIKRFDGTIIFETLGNPEHRLIAKAEILKIKTRLADKALTLTVSDAVYAYLASKLEDGDTARDLNTVVKRSVTAPISKLLITDKDYNEFVVELVDGEITVRGVEVGAKEEGCEKTVPSRPRRTRTSKRGGGTGGTSLQA